MKKTISIVLAFLMVFALCPQIVLSAFAIEGIPYLCYNTEIGDYETLYCEDATDLYNDSIPIDESINEYALEPGWYYVKQDIKIGTPDALNTYGKNLAIKGDVYLIIPDNVSLIVDGSIYIETVSSSLTIFTQSLGEKMGTIKACGNSENKAGIGACRARTYETSGKITIHGGNIIAKGNGGGAGIGGDGGYKEGNATYGSCCCGTITIYGGKIQATGGSKGGSGIGSGGCYTTSLKNVVSIYGGEITAIGSKGAAGIGGGAMADSSLSGGGKGADVTINGGKITAYSNGNGAGIGGGVQDGDGGNFVMNGGEVIAYSTGDGAGIGSSSSDDETLDNDSGYVTINGGILTAYSMGSGAGIGGGAENDACENVTINGGSVTAYSMGDGAGIGGGRSGYIVDGDGGDVIINDGIVTAYSMGNGAGIGGGDNGDSGNVTINGGNVTARSYKNGAGIGGGEDGDGGKFVMTDGNVLAESKWHGAGIGSGSSYDSITDDNSGSVEIGGGKVEAFSNGDGAGIGGGDENDGCDSVLITGGTVTAYSLMNGAGIGGGASGYVVDGDGGPVNIAGGTVTAYSEMDGAGIGGGKGGDGGEVNVSNANVSAYSLGDGAGIGGGKGGDGNIVNLSSGSIRAVSNKGGAGIGGGNGGDSGKFAIKSGRLSCLSKNSVGVGEGKGGSYNADKDYIYPSNYYIFDTETGLANKYNFTNDWKGLFRSSDFDVYLVEKGSFSVPYRVYDENGNYTDYEKKDYTYLDSKTTTWSDGWYVLDGEGTFSTPIHVQGNANLILVNDSKFTVNGGIVIDDTSTLTIYEQKSNLGSEPGTLTANGELGKAGISGNLIVHGGNIIAKGNNAAGIGGNNTGNKSGSNLTLYNGNITAKGGSESAGIGGVKVGKGGNLKIYKGKVTAVAGFLSQRAIGAGHLSTDNGTITVPDYVSLFDSETKEEIVKPEGKTWNDVLNQASVSFYAMLSSESEITYWDYDYTENNFFRNSKLRRDCIELDSTKTVWDKDWYVAKGNVSISDVTVKGNVNLILENECRLEIGKGIRVDKGNSITIYARSLDNTNDTVGNLVISGGRSSSCAGIGGYRNSDCGKVTINGGDLMVKGGYTCAGIGGGENADAGTVIINGGEIDAFGGTRAAGIGTGANGTSGSVTINGGTLNVKSDEAYGAGIGSGDSGSIDTITINGGNISANGGDAGAGIGSGCGGNAESIVINGGTIDAISTMFAAGIGAGDAGSVNSIEINGGDVTATSGESGVGIGANRYSIHCGKIAINNGVVKASGGERSIGVGNEGFSGYSKDITLGTGMLVYELAEDGTPVRKLDFPNLVDMFADTNSVLIQKDSINWEMYSGHKHKGVLRLGVAPTKNNAGYKNYYECFCGKFFEDADCKKEITDIEKWKAEGGSGYIAKLGEEPKSPKTADTSDMTLWVVLLIVAYMGIVTIITFGKKEKKI